MRAQERIKWMNAAELSELAEQCVTASRNHANSQLDWELPDRYVHKLLVEGRPDALFRLNEVVSALLAGSLFPRVVDVSIGGLANGHTLVLWRPSAEPPVENIKDTWNQGFGPFKPMGLMVPYVLEGASPRSPDDLELIGRKWFRKGKD